MLVMIGENVLYPQRVLMKIFCSLILVIACAQLANASDCSSGIDDDFGFLARKYPQLIDKV